ncbi:MAG: transporter substrate-binding domain-containing protein [Colwellia sp.]
MIKKQNNRHLKGSFQHLGWLKPRWINVYFSLLVWLISLPLSAKNKLIVVVGLTKPPYVVQDNETGFEIELIRNILTKMGKSTEFIYTPFGHSSKMLTVDEVDAVMTTNSRIFNDPKKLSDIYITYENIAISLKNKRLAVDSISDLANYSIASFQKAEKVLGSEFASAIKKSPLVLQVADQKRQPILLLKERVDVVVMDRHIFNYFTRELKVDKPESKFSFHNIFPKTHYRMAFKNTQNTRLFNKAFFDYSKSEVYRALLKKYQLFNVPTEATKKHQFK